MRFFGDVLDESGVDRCGAAPARHRATATYKREKSARAGAAASDMALLLSSALGSSSTEALAAFLEFRA